MRKHYYARDSSFNRLWARAYLYALYTPYKSLNQLTYTY
jgi:hypothetical protein